MRVYLTLGFVAVASPVGSQVFITPMPLLRFMAACGMPHLKNLDEAVGIMRAAMLGVIQVRERGSMRDGAALSAAGGAGGGLGPGHSSGAFCDPVGCVL